MTKTNIPKGYHRHPNGGGLVEDTAFVAESVFVGPNAQVSGKAQVFGNAWVYENAQVYGNARVSGNAQVHGNAQVYGNAWVYGGARIDRGNHTISPLVIQGTRDILRYLGENWVAIGCEQHSISEWLENYREIGKRSRYSESEIEEYYQHLLHTSRWINTIKEKNNG